MRNANAQANMLAYKFHMCSEDVKIALFRAYCTPLYTAPIWCSYTKAKINKFKVAYHQPNSVSAISFLAKLRYIDLTVLS